MLPLGYIDPGTGFTIATAGGGFVAFMIGLFGGGLLVVRRFFKKHPIRAVCGLLLIVVILSFAVYKIAKIFQKDSTMLGKKIILLGFDAMDAALTEAMMEEGKLPNFSKLKIQGSYRRLATTNPPQSPVAWSSFATGQNPGKHGIYDFIRRNPEDYSLDLAVSKIDGRTVRPVKQTPSWWTYTSQKGIRHKIIQCPITFPPDDVHGEMLSGMGVPDIIGTQGTFSFYTTETVKKPKDVGGDVYQVKGEDTVEAVLRGPKTSGRFGSKVLEIPFSVKRGDREAQLNIQEQNISLVQGKISPWISVSFRAGWWKRIHGTVRFVLLETSPGFKLYATPVNFHPEKPLFPISSPKDYAKELTREVGLFATQGMPFDTWAVNEKRIPEDIFLQFSEEIFETKKKILYHELGRFEDGIFFCYFEDADILQHMFMRYTDAAHPIYERSEKYQKIIETAYQNLDRVLGKVMRLAGPQDIVMVLSDHGMKTFRRAAHINSWLRKHGYLVLKDPGASSAEELLSGVDWSKTRAYAVGFGAVYLNLKGREGKGIVSPGREADDLVRELRKKFRVWTDPQNGQNIVKNVYNGREIFNGPLEEQMPDLYLGFAEGYRASWQTAMGATPAPLIVDNTKKWSGDHLCDPSLVPGVLFSTVKGLKDDPALQDFAPTILRLCGFTEEEIAPFDFDGSTFLTE